MTEKNLATEQSRNDRASAEGSPRISNEPPPELLKELVERFRVCWEVWPEYVYVEREKRQIGFALELYGTHEPGTGHVDPGCRHCQRVFAALQTIADWIQPRDLRPSMYEIAPYDQSISYSSVRDNREDVCLALRILHRSGFERPVGKCQVQCLEEMKQRLRELGACDRRWSRSKEARS